jgi:hypothetical protein
MVSLCLWRLCSELYIGTFTKVSWVVLMEAVACGMATCYEQVAPVPVLAKASGAWLRGLLDLGILATRKSSLISLNFVYKVSNLQRKK